MKTVSFLFALMLCGMLIFGFMGCNAERSAAPADSPAPVEPAPELPEPVDPQS